MHCEAYFQYTKIIFLTRMSLKKEENIKTQPSLVIGVIIIIFWMSVRLDIQLKPIGNNSLIKWLEVAKFLKGLFIFLFVNINKKQKKSIKTTFVFLKQEKPPNFSNIGLFRSFNKLGNVFHPKFMIVFLGISSKELEISLLFSLLRVPIFAVNFLMGIHKFGT